jgi:hypothetical protein
MAPGHTRYPLIDKEVEPFFEVTRNSLRTKKKKR